jgi:CMP/dCMP kinase
MSEKPKFLVTLDGLSATGKTSLGTALAKHFNFSFLSSGAIYRLVAFVLAPYLNQIECNKGDFASLLHEHFRSKNINLEDDAIYLDGQRYNLSLLHTPLNSELTSKLSVYNEVREVVNTVIHKLVANKEIVVEGRDMGSEVFVNANVKFFITVDEEIKQLRREKQSGQELKSNDLKRELVERDLRDKTRKIAPTLPANDAILVDNTTTPFLETLNFLIDQVKERYFK